MPTPVDSTEALLALHDEIDDEGEAGLLRLEVGGFPAGTLVRWVDARQKGYLALDVRLPDDTIHTLHSDDVVQRRA